MHGLTDKTAAFVFVPFFFLREKRPLMLCLPRAHVLRPLFFNVSMSDIALAQQGFSQKAWLTIFATVNSILEDLEVKVPSGIR